MKSISVILQNLTFWVLLVNLPQIVWAQNMVVEINPYNQSIRIGEQTRVDINVLTSAEKSIIWPQFSDTVITQIELIDAPKIDTILSDTSDPTSVLGYQMQLTLTSFDSGLWAFPELTLYIDSIPFTTEAFLLEVQTIEVDTARAFRDIVQPKDIPMTFWEYIQKYYIYAVYTYLAIVVLAILAYLIGKNANKTVKKPPVPIIPAHILARNRLKELESEKLWQQGAFKAYHIQLSFIIREYLENRFAIPVLESTTDEIKHLLRQQQLEKSLRDAVIKALRISDLAKFAKAIPLAEENEWCLTIAYELVDKTHVEPEKNSSHE